MINFFSKLKFKIKMQNEKIKRLRMEEKSADSDEATLRIRVDAPLFEAI